MALAAYSGTLNLETWMKERAAAKRSEEMDFRPPHTLSCPSPPRHGDDRDRTPPRLIREENDEDIPGDHQGRRNRPGRPSSCRTNIEKLLKPKVIL